MIHTTWGSYSLHYKQREDRYEDMYIQQQAKESVSKGFLGNRPKFVLYLKSRPSILFETFHKRLKKYLIKRIPKKRILASNTCLK